jgi:hypothetical protein
MHWAQGESCQVMGLQYLLIAAKMKCNESAESWHSSPQFIKNFPQQLAQFLLGFCRFAKQSSRSSSGLLPISCMFEGPRRSEESRGILKLTQNLMTKYEIFYHLSSSGRPHTLWKDSREIAASARRNHFCFESNTEEVATANLSSGPALPSIKNIINKYLSLYSV